MKKISLFLLVITFITQLNLYSQTGWVQVYNGGSPSQNNVLDITFINQLTGYAAGGYQSLGYVLKTTNGGQTWTTSLSSSTALQSLSFVNENTGYVVGGYNPVSLIYKTTNGGQTWSQQTSGTPYCYFSSYFINENTGIVVGDWGNIRKTTNGGNTWFGCNSGTPDYLESVCFINQNTGYSAGREGQIVKTTDGGNTWNLIMYIGTWLNSIKFLNDNTGYAVGKSGMVLNTTNGGGSWQIVSMGLSFNLSNIVLLNQNIIYIVGDYGNVLKTINGGLNWTLQNVGSSNNLSGLYFLDSLVGFASGTYGSIYKTQSGGMILPLPVLISPPNNSNNLSVTPTLIWSEISGVTNYLVQISPLSNFSVIADSATLTSNQRIVPPGKLQPNTTYFWRVRATNAVGTGVWTDAWSFGTTSVGINQLSSEMPAVFNLYQNYPNPFNPVTKIKFDVPEKSSVNLKIYNINGKEIVNLYSGIVNAGVFEVNWNAANFSTGVYFLRFYSEKYSAIKKLILAK